MSARTSHQGCMHSTLQCRTVQTLWPPAGSRSCGAAPGAYSTAWSMLPCPFLSLRALHLLGPEVIGCQPGIVNLQDNVGILNSCSKNLGQKKAEKGVKKSLHKMLHAAGGDLVREDQSSTQLLPPGLALHKDSAESVMLSCTAAWQRLPMRVAACPWHRRHCKEPNWEEKELRRSNGAQMAVIITPKYLFWDFEKDWPFNEQ